MFLRDEPAQPYCACVCIELAALPTLQITSRRFPLATEPPLERDAPDHRHWREGGKQGLSVGSGVVNVVVYLCLFIYSN